MDALQSARSRKRINQIDRIRSYGIGDIVSLPQLVVCGDQSAGKSSVLEGITGMPFPRKDGICTRFPTEIILRRNATERSIVATVQPHSSQPTSTRGRLSGFRRTMVDMSELPQVTFEVSELMGLRGHPNVVEGSAFASDVLRIEVTGHTDLNLTVVDLPGLISVANEEQTNADVKLIRSMVKRYISRSRAIILAVVQAGNDIANQSIVELAHKYDPQGQRTVGIITKTDLINKGTEGRLAELAMNQGNIKLELGFFLLKNPTPAELEAGITTEQRLRQETEFFASPIWNSQKLDMNRVGVANLRLFLQYVLDSHIEKELPNVIEEIKHHLQETEASLIFLGPKRSRISDVRLFITKISMDYCLLLQAALGGDYYGDQQEYFHNGSNTKLRAVIHRLNTDFATRIREDGQKRNASNAIKPESEDTKLDDLENNGTKVERLLISKQRMKEWVKRVSIGLAVLDSANIRQVYLDTRGRELPGNHNYLLLAELFREQSSPWEPLARAHIRGVFAAVVQWVRDAVGKTVPEERVRREISIICVRWIEDTEVRATEELGKLLADERQHPITYNHYYSDNIQRARYNGLFMPIHAVLESTLDVETKANALKSTNGYEKLIGAIKGKIIVDMDEQACSEALVCLNAYYKVAMKTFVDNVCRQVIERHLVARLPDMFNPFMITQLTDERIMLLGSEPEGQQRKRDELATRKRILVASLADLQHS
ncbi:Interferon-induced GTP-binding protein Mx [Apiospora phragmitis]|uniref:Interferon-induced GTP-binding protein Mx n=1 Tax=Apiospora phragmitis TaxID=2905665 RepID=A0ABR1UVQ2_9PEZI